MIPNGCFTDGDYPSRLEDSYWNTRAKCIEGVCWSIFNPHEKMYIEGFDYEIPRRLKALNQEGEAMIPIFRTCCPQSFQHFALFQGGYLGLVNSLWNRDSMKKKSGNDGEQMEEFTTGKRKGDSGEENTSMSWMSNVKYLIPRHWLFKKRDTLYRAQVPMEKIIHVPMNMKEKKKKVTAWCADRTFFSTMYPDFYWRDNLFFLQGE